MKKQRSIVCQAEDECLERLRKPVFPKGIKGFKAILYRCRDQAIMLDLLHTRLEEARDVIDAVARTIGMQPEESDIWIYALEEEKGKNPILKALEEMMEGEQKNAKN